MNRKPFVAIALGLALLTFVGCSAQPPEQKEPPEASSDLPQEAPESSEVSSESFESGQVETDPESQVETTAEEETEPENPDSD